MSKKVSSLPQFCLKQNIRLLYLHKGYFRMFPNASFCKTPTLISKKYIFIQSCSPNTYCNPCIFCTPEIINEVFLRKEHASEKSHSQSSPFCLRFSHIYLECFIASDSLSTQSCKKQLCCLADLVLTFLCSFSFASHAIFYTSLISSQMLPSVQSNV